MPDKSAQGKASAIAYPIQGLVKYHGLKDPVRRIPFHASISVCTGPIHTHTTIEVLDGAPARTAQRRSSITIDGQVATGRAQGRVEVVMDAIREKAGDDRPFRMVSQNDFPKFVGLGSSSSGFAALAVAAAAAYGWKATPAQLSEVARLGAGSASRAVTGGVSEWVLDKERSYSKMLLGPNEVDWRIVVPLVPHEEPTENMHAEATTSPLFQARLGYIEGALAAMRTALTTKRLDQIAPIAETDTLNLHAITMTGSRGHVIWRAATIDVMHTVRRLRGEGVPVWFSIDTGATAYLNTDAAHKQQVANAVRGIAGVTQVLHLKPAGPAHLVDRHLF